MKKPWEPRILESGAIVAGAAIAAGGAAYSANQQKKAASKAAKAAGAPQTQTIDQTTTQTGWAPVQGDLSFAAQEARRLYDQGPVLKGGGGKGKGGGGGAAGSYGGYSMAEIDANPALLAKLGGNAKAKYQADKAGGGKPAKPPSMATQARGVAQDIIDKGKAGSPNQGAADAYLGRVFEEGGLAGNEVYQDLNSRYANASLDKGTSLLEGFLGGKYGSGGGGAAGAGAPATAGRNVRYKASGTGSASGSVGTVPGASGGPAGGQYITDQTQASGTFNDWAKEVLNGKYLDPNDPVLKDYLDVIQREGQADLDAQLQDVGDEFEGVGMYGGSGLALERALARSQGNQGIADSRTKALYEFRGQGLDMMGNTAGMVNERDIAGSGMASNERMNRDNARASANAAGAGIDAQLQIANRQMDLEAINSYLNNQQFGLSELGKIGGAVSADRMAGVGALGELEDLRYGGLERAYGVSSDLAQKDAAQRARRERQRYENAQAPGRHLDEYMNRLGFFNNVGGTSTTKGTTASSGGPVAPYSGPSPFAAGLMAGAGTYFQGQAARGSAPAKAAPYKGPSANDLAGVKF